MHERFLNFHCLIKREQELHESWQARVYMRVFSTFIAWSNENKSRMRVDKREFTWEVSSSFIPWSNGTRVAWELTSESLHESFLIFHCMIKREQKLHESWQREFTWEFSQLSLLDQTRTKLHESWQARVYMRVFSTFIAWSNENKSRMRVDKREFTWEVSQLSFLDQTEQELHESWQARVYMRVFSTFIAWSNENKSRMRVDKREFTWEVSQLSFLDQTERVAWKLISESLHDSFLYFHCLIKWEQELHESWQARVYMRVFSTFIALSNENKNCIRVDRREFTWEFSQLSLLDQTEQELHESWQARVYMRVFSTFIPWSNGTRVAWELTGESLHESFLNFHCLIKREQESDESWQARVYIRSFSTFIPWSNGTSCMKVDKWEFTWQFSLLSLLDQMRTRVIWELTSESLHESFLNFHCFIKREQKLHESWQARVYMRVFSTFIAWPNENKSCMRVDKREFTWQFSQLSLLDQMRTRVIWELTSESLHESFLNFHCFIKREQKLHKSWQARVYMRVFSTFIAWSNGTRVAWELTGESLHESFLNFHCLIKREQESDESWQARVYIRSFSTFIPWSNGTSCMKVDKWEFTWQFSLLSLLDQMRTRVIWELTSESLHESFLNFHCFIKREQKLHESWQARVYMRVFSTFIAWPNENKSCMRVDKREFTWQFSQLSLLDQTRTRVGWELTSESLHESLLNFHSLIKREQELHESWQVRVYMRVFSTFIAWSNENKSYMRVDKREFTWEFSQPFIAWSKDWLLLLKIISKEKIMTLILRNKNWCESTHLCPCHLHRS